MSYRIDYHMHPNLGRSPNRALRRARAWWDAFAAHKLAAAVVTEHAYKHPSESYHALVAARPDGATTTLYPGVELITKEGADLIVCAERPAQLYGATRLLAPYALRYEEAVAETRARGLFAYVTHPTTLGTTSVLRRRGEAFTRLMIERLGVIERHNAAYLDVAAVCRRLPTRFARHLAGELDERSDMPAALYAGIKTLTWVGGSDAHHPHDLGSHVAFPGVPPQDRSALWQAITAQHNGTFVFRTPQETMPRVLHQAGSVFLEYMRKQPFHLRAQLQRRTAVAWEYQEVTFADELER